MKSKSAFEKAVECFETHGKVNEDGACAVIMLKVKPTNKEIEYFDHNGVKITEN